ncbi:hypothetical protein CBM2623_B80058 [Cupriavidus taiwanensis]|nr:hypothetical protein CBM2588_B100058 [Cupriavidus taiwanensis]SOY97994.1 hypothetical protein CBM2591_B80209 [Cupriavidus taiwanensis]SOZ84915.1 hypothetical protein CBM2618_B120018 [Cupriavidus taiwanensis]SOZ88142.1 hypothetical protein CBM2622_B130017 [Cupriavidus taiwanensis]SPA36433.1 hypothetical protein CBM2623_B80058 [Cupriavidus taiwanensis]
MEPAPAMGYSTADRTLVQIGENPHMLNYPELRIAPNRTLPHASWSDPCVSKLQQCKP